MAAEPVTCTTPGCSSGGTVQVTIHPILASPDEPVACPDCYQPLALTPDQLQRAMSPNAST